MEATNKDIIESYLGGYSTSTKAYRTQGDSDFFFREVAKFLLEVAYLNSITYYIPKN